MPYFLKQVGKKYYVVDTTGKQYSKKPLPKARAERQMKALHINTGHGLYGGADDGDDPEMAGLMEQEPVAFMPAPGPVHNPFAGLFEPAPRRVRRQRQKRAISTVQGAIPINAQKRQRTGFGRKKRGGKLSETWPMVKDHLDQISAQVGFYSMSPGEKQNYLEEQLKSVLLEMIHLLDEFHEKKNLITRGTTYIKKILSGTFTPDLEQQQALKEGLAEIEGQPVHQIIGAPSGDTPVFKRLPLSEYGIGTNPADTRYYYQQRSTNTPYPTEANDEEQTVEQTVEQLREINKRTGKYEGDLRRGEGRYRFRYTEPDTHILIGDYLEGSGTGKWTALINALSRMYSIPKALVDSTIALNDRQSGQYRFNAKKQNILSQFSDYLNPTIVNEILELDESDPKSVSDYANTINGRSEMALNLRAVNTVNPLQVSVATSNPLSGRGRRKYKGGGTGKWSDLIYELGRLDNLTGPMIERAINRNDRIVHSDPRERFALKKQNVLESFPRRRDALDQLLVYETFDNLRARQVIDSLRANRQRTPAVQQGNPLHQAQQLAVNASFPVEPTQAVGVVDMVSNPGCIGCGQGKLKFVKKYLKGQGLKATKKNVEKICNIMDVEGVVFE